MNHPSDQKRPRDPKDRPVNPHDEAEKRERALDKTIADSFPTSDPASTIPDPGTEDSLERTA